uniref:Uncharacterized protein n=1 Tax=Daphnia galeata TaxID=27404 RepID=A0A8J2S6S5_9CRUS|nr:unnamed protein product [Daphnia galeata]
MLSLLIHVLICIIKMPDDKKDSNDDGKKSGSSSQSGRIGGFRDVPIDFDAGNEGDNKKNKNKNKGGSGDKKKEMPTVYIWYPDDKDHPYGHTALLTDKYYISFWPDGDISEMGKLQAAFHGVPGSLHFHCELDRYCEGNRLPTGSYEIDNATDEAINKIHEEFLEYNGINPADVTLEEGEKHIDDIKNKGWPQKSVAKTLYSYNAHFEGQSSALDLIVPGNALNNQPKNLLLPKRSTFYYHKQSCVSFCFNIIEDADPNPQEMHSKLFDLPTNSQTTGQQVERFRKYPVDFTNGQKKVSKKNNTYAVLMIVMLNDSSSA